MEVKEIIVGKCCGPHSNGADLLDPSPCPLHIFRSFTVPRQWIHFVDGSNLNFYTHNKGTGKWFDMFFVNFLVSILECVDV